MKLMRATAWLQQRAHMSLPVTTINNYVEEIKHVDDLWYLGCGLVVLASLFSSLSVNLQKHAHLLTFWHNPRLRSKKRIQKLAGPVWRRPEWMLGLSLLIIGSICDFIALAFCSQITVGVLGALSMVINLLVTSVYLNEPVGRLELISTSIIITGCVICVIASSEQTKAVHTVDQIMALYRNVDCLIFLVFVSFIICILRLIVGFSSRIRHPQLHRFCYPASAGLVGSQGVLFGKYTAEIFHSILVHGKTNNAFSQPINIIETVLVVFCLFLSLFLQLRWLNQGLHYFDALFTVPTFQVCWVIGSVSGGAIVFQELTHMDSNRDIMFMAGVIMAISGVLLMAQRKVPEESN